LFYLQFKNRNLVGQTLGFIFFFLDLLSVLIYLSFQLFYLIVTDIGKNCLSNKSYKKQKTKQKQQKS